MIMRVHRRWPIVFLMAVLCELTACLKWPAEDNSAHPDKVLFERAMFEVESNRFDVAHLILQTLINTYPDSEYASEAAVVLGDPRIAKCSESCNSSPNCHPSTVATPPTEPKIKELQMRLKTSQLLFCASLLTCLPAFGQRVALFGGYQLTHLDGGPTFNGWNASLTGSLVPFFGITADFSGAYKSGARLHTYTFGPEVRAHVGGLRPFAHALIGGGTSYQPFVVAVGSGALSIGSTNGLVMFYGGGLDVKTTRFASIRLGQFDWMVTRFNGFTDKNSFRYSAGLVLHF